MHTVLYLALYSTGVSWSQRLRRVLPSMRVVHSCPARTSFCLLLCCSATSAGLCLNGVGVASRRPVAQRSISQMVDVSLAGEAISGSSSLLPSYVPYNPHTMDNLLPDLVNTAVCAGLGLMGAYVTRVRKYLAIAILSSHLLMDALCAVMSQGAEGLDGEPRAERQQRVRSPSERRTRRRSVDQDSFDDDLLDEWFEKPGPTEPRSRFR